MDENPLTETQRKILGWGLTAAVMLIVWGFILLFFAWAFKAIL